VPTSIRIAIDLGGQVELPSVRQRLINGVREGSAGGGADKGHVWQRPHRQGKDLASTHRHVTHEHVNRSEISTARRWFNIQRLRLNALGPDTNLGKGEPAAIGEAVGNMQGKGIGAAGIAASLE
jgi:hypothetical protein